MTVTGMAVPALRGTKSPQHMQHISQTVIRKQVRDKETDLPWRSVAPEWISDKGLYGRYFHRHSPC